MSSSSGHRNICSPPFSRPPDSCLFVLKVRGCYTCRYVGPWNNLRISCISWGSEDRRYSSFHFLCVCIFWQSTGTRGCKRREPLRRQRQKDQDRVERRRRNYAQLCGKRSAAVCCEPPGVYLMLLWMKSHLFLEWQNAPTKVMTVCCCGCQMLHWTVLWGPSAKLYKSGLKRLSIISPQPDWVRVKQSLYLLCASILWVPMQNNCKSAGGSCVFATYIIKSLLWGQLILFNLSSYRACPVIYVLHDCVYAYKDCTSP